MAEPLTKEELALARGYAESVYADTTDPQKHTTAVMILRLLDTVAALEAELARLRPLAEVGEAVEGMRPGDVLLRASETKWRTGAGAMASTTNRSITIIHWADKVRNTALAALRAAKKTPTTKAVEANDE